MARDQFTRHLRDALNHLQDPQFLRSSPLAALFGIADRFDTFSALQRILTEAIESLEPDATEPSQSRAWRTYESLYYRYVQQCGQQEIADQLGIGTRHLRREQQAALEALAERLWVQHDLGSVLPDGSLLSRSSTVQSDQQAHVHSELSWIAECSTDTPTDLAEGLENAVGLAQTLADRHSVDLVVQTPDTLPPVSVHPVALTQMLISLFSVAIHRSLNSVVSIEVEVEPYDVLFRVRGQAAPHGGNGLSENDATSIKLAQRLMDMCGGRLEVSDGKTGFEAMLALPVFELVSVLVIDDSADTQQLLQRYAIGTRYRVVGTRDPGEAVGVARSVSPQAILLDVMMPQVDGWKVLARLRQHPDTERFPVIVCTIMAQEELALALGASGFLRKPVSRQDFLDVLDRVGQVASESH